MPAVPYEAAGQLHIVSRLHAVSEFASAGSGGRRGFFQEICETIGVRSVLFSVLYLYTRWQCASKCSAEGAFSVYTTFPLPQTGICFKGRRCCTAELLIYTNNRCVLQQLAADMMLAKYRFIAKDRRCLWSLFCDCLSSFEITMVCLCWEITL